MKDILRRTTNSIIFSSIIAFIVGLIMALNPNMSMQTIGIMAACYMIVYGIVLIVLDFKASRYFVPFDGLLSGIVSVVIGFILIGKPSIISTLLTIAIGIWIALTSINTIKISLAVRNIYTGWILLLLLGILDLLAGIIVAFNPFEASISIVVFAGIMIMTHSIINIIDMIIIKRDVKSVSKAIETVKKSI